VVEKEVSLAVNGEECRIVFIDHQVIHLTDVVSPSQVLSRKRIVASE
jgi:hypothetical protein